MGGAKLSAAIKVFVSNNFKVDQLIDLPDESALSNPRISYDERNHILTYDLDLSNWQWYYNYLDFVYTISNSRNTKATWLLDLGFVPIVYLPSCCSSYASLLFKIMDNASIPYIKMQPYSFLSRYVSDMALDGWMSKMEASKLLGLAPEKITSEIILKELILNERNCKENF